MRGETWESFQQHILKQEIQLYMNFIKLTKLLQAGAPSFWNQLTLKLLLILKFYVTIKSTLDIHFNSFKYLLGPVRQNSLD